MASSGDSDARPQLKSIDSIPFSALCKLLIAVENNRKISEKRRILGTFLETFHSAPPKDRRADLFPVVRLILPEYDRERERYGLGVKQIAKIYKEAYGIPDHSDGGKMLRNFKAGAGGGARAKVQRFPEALERVLLKYAEVEPSGATVSDVNACFDTICSETDLPAKSSALRNLVLGRAKARFSAMESRWLAKILLRNLHIGLTLESVLQLLHPSALDLFNRTSNLRSVVNDCVRPDFKAPPLILTVGSSVRPMLAAIATPQALSSQFTDGVNSSLFFETKYDGERVMIHKKDEELSYFSRNGHEVSGTYGDRFSSIVLSNVRASTCILDGEMLVWDTENEQFLKFGYNRTLGRAGSEETPELQFCFVAFDILLLNGTSLLGHTYENRRNLLRSAISTIVPHQLEISENHALERLDDVYTALEEAFERGEEGIMIKSASSIYAPNSRDKGWLKLKHDHGDHGETLDCVIVGGYYGTKYGRNSISHFLLAIRDNSLSSVSCKFCTLCRIGTGYSDMDLKYIQTRLSSLWTSYEPVQSPGTAKWLQLFGGRWTPRGSIAPDVIVDPMRSVVMEVKAFEILRSDQYSSGFTLRFPRVVGIRTDKQPQDCNDMDFLQALRTANGGLLNRPTRESKSRRRGEDAASSSESRGENRDRRARKSRAGTDGKDVTSTVQGRRVLPSYRNHTAADARSSYEGSSNGRDALQPFPAMVQRAEEKKIFADVSVSVCNEGLGYHPTRLMVETWISAAGGTVYHKPSYSNTSMLIAFDEVSDLAVRNQIAYGTKYPDRAIDIVHYSWVVECIEAGTLVPLQPTHLIWQSPNTKAGFAETYDAFGDSFTGHTTGAMLKRILERCAPKEPASAPLSQATRGDANTAISLETEDDVDGSLTSSAGRDVYGDERYRFWSEQQVYFTEASANDGNDAVTASCDRHFALKVKIRFFRGTVVDSAGPRTTIVVVPRNLSRGISDLVVDSPHAKVMHVDEVVQLLSSGRSP